MNLYHLKCFPFSGLLPPEENDRPNASIVIPPKETAAWLASAIV